MLHVEQADMFEWLPRHAGIGPVVAVLPDAAEMGLDIAAWRLWFIRAARACFEVSTGPTVFMQTDRRYDGAWIDKSALIGVAARGRPLMWHKIVLRRAPGAIDLKRPTYSHLVAYGPARPGARTPDVMEAGHMRWANGMGEAVAAHVANYLRAQGAQAVVNPCTGYGTVLAAAIGAGLDAYGCDIDAARAARAAQVVPLAGVA